jgi:hydroxyacylglutathione hydrolase
MESKDLISTDDRRIMMVADGSEESDALPRRMYAAEIVPRGIVMTTPSLIFRQLRLGPMMNYVYILGCAETRAAAVVDPAWNVRAILDVTRDLELRLCHILITHAHPDHVNGLEELLEATDAKAYLNAEEMTFVNEMARIYQIPIEFMSQYSSRIIAVSDEAEIRVGNHPVRCLHTPGHTPGSQCFLVEGKLFAGDTLFVDACGRVDLPGGDPALMWRSLNRRLRALEDDIILYPGHNYGGRPASTMGEQKRSNPYMQYASADQFVRAMGPG